MTPSEALVMGKCNEFLCVVLIAWRTLILAGYAHELLAIFVFAYIERDFHNQKPELKLMT